MNVTPSQFDALWQLMDVSALRHQVVSNNVANVNTPGFQSQKVSFEERLEKRLSELNSADLAGLHPEILRIDGLPERADGNNVDIDKEMGQLSKNSLLYQTYAQVIASKLGMMRSAITGK